MKTLNFHPSFSLDSCVTRFGNFSGVKALGLMFLGGFFLRLVPELLAGALPIGFDTVYYAVGIKSGVVWANWNSFFSSSWLIYALTVPVYSLLQVDPFLLLKVVAPALFGLNVAGVFFFARKVLHWNLLMSGFTGFFFALQLASLRISWDLLRNTLGMGVLLFALAFMNDVDSKRGFVFFSILSLLSVFAHEYAAVTLVVVALGLVIWQQFKHQDFSSSKRLLLGVLPALFVFVLILWFYFFPTGITAETNIISAGEPLRVKAGDLFFLENYLAVNSSAISYAGYWDLVFNVGALFALLFLPYLFLVLKGYFRNKVLDLWTGLLLVGAFGCLLVPFAALQFWYRWMFMLVYPFTFFAVSGFRRLAGLFRSGNLHLSSFFSNKKAAAMVLLTFIFGGVYLVTPCLMMFTGSSLPMPSSTSLYFSTSPAVPYEDVDSVSSAMSWLDKNMDEGSSVILQYVFLSFGQLYLDKSKTIVHFQSDVDSAMEIVGDHGFSSVFFVYWNQPIGWAGCISVPDYFVSVQDFGRISVYHTEGENIG